MDELYILYTGSQALLVEVLRMGLVAELKPNSWTYNFVEVSGHTLESSQTCGSVYNVYITNQFQTTFTQVEVTVNSMERNS
jgi:hypothetical protein